VLAGSRSVAWMVPTVAQQLRLMGHERVFEGQAKQVHNRTTIIYRKEAKENSENVKNSVPEFADADVIENDDIASDYNSPVVVVLGTGFATPNLVSIYGRLMKPTLDFENMGERVKSFS